MKVALFLICIFGIKLIYADFDDFNEDCRYKWKSYWQCVNQENGHYSDRRFLTSSEGNQLTNYYQKCFSQARCNAFDWRLISARNDCFNRYKSETANYLRSCVERRSARSFDLPDAAYDPNSQDQYKNFLRRIANEQNFCRPESRNIINQCIESNFNQYTRRQRDSGDECQNKKYKCGPKISQNCYQRWNQDVKNLLRQCINDDYGNQQRQRIQQAYKGCVGQRTDYRYDQFMNDDTHYRWFETGNLNSKYVDRREPCGGSIF